MRSLLWMVVAAIYVGLGVVSSGGLRLVYFALAAAVVALEIYKRRRRRLATEDAAPESSE